MQSDIDFSYCSEISVQCLKKFEWLNEAMYFSKMCAVAYR